MQFIATFVWLVENSSGTCKYGDVIYNLGFVLTCPHDLFTGIAVPASLIWGSLQLLGEDGSPDALLAAIVGTLWYSPASGLYHIVPSLTQGP